MESRQPACCYPHRTGYRYCRCDCHERTSDGYKYIDINGDTIPVAYLRATHVHTDGRACHGYASEHCNRDTIMGMPGASPGAAKRR